MNRYYFNPFEISICGYSGLGKTTLTCKLIERLSKKYKLGYVKADAHQFDMDKKGKDTWLASQSGSDNVSIYSSKKETMAYLGAKNINLLADAYLNSDMVLVEGLKKEPHLAKIVLVDSEQKILKEVDKNTIVMKLDHHQRNDINLIEETIIQSFNQKINQTPLYGLVLTGGFSKRMGQDKALLSYHNRVQYQHCLATLDKFCDQTFLSCRSEQKENYPTKNKKIYDEFLNMGPIGGILSAQKQQPKAAWLVIACDMPNLTEKTLNYLVNNRNPFKLATAFNSTTDSLAEPLCAIYEPKSYPIFLNFLAHHNHSNENKNKHLCPRKILMQSDYQALKVREKKALDNINTYEAYQQLTQK